MARQGGLIPFSSLQSLHVREAQRDKVQVCISLLLHDLRVSVCVCHFVIRNVIKMSKGLCAFYYVVVIIVCVGIDKAKRSRYDLLR